MYLSQTELFEIELIIYINMDLVLNNLQRLICHKSQPTNQPTTQICTNNTDTRNLTKKKEQNKKTNKKNKNLKKKSNSIFYQLDNGNDYTKCVNVCV